jgi:hypothetical protein
MTTEEIVEAAKEHEKKTCFGEIVKSPISKGVNSAYGIGFLEGAEFVNNSNEASKDKHYKELIKMLIDELNTSKLYHLGITSLDTDEEIAEKRRKGECALIRGIERTIKYVEESIK